MARCQVKGPACPSATKRVRGTAHPKANSAFQAFHVNVGQTERRCSNFEGFPMCKQDEERSSSRARSPFEPHSSIIILIIPMFVDVRPPPFVFASNLALAAGCTRATLIREQQHASGSRIGLVRNGISETVSSRSLMPVLRCVIFWKGCRGSCCS